jgi:hypothetical protein
VTGGWPWWASRSSWVWTVAGLLGVCGALTAQACARQSPAICGWTSVGKHMLDSRVRVTVFNLLAP